MPFLGAFYYLHPTIITCTHDYYLYLHLNSKKTKIPFVVTLCCCNHCCPCIFFVAPTLLLHPCPHYTPLSNVVLLQDSDEHVVELVITEFANEVDLVAKYHNENGDVNRGDARDGEKRKRVKL